MGDAAQAGLDPTDDDGDVFVRLTAALSIDCDGAIGALAGCALRCVSIVRADLAVGRVAIDHRIHIASGDAEEQIGSAQLHEIRRRGPIRLGDDADPKSLCLQHSSNHRHAEAGVVHVGITGDDDDIAAVPAQGVHFGARHRQERRRAEAPGPELTVGEQIARAVHARDREEVGATGPGRQYSSAGRGEKPDRGVRKR